MKKRYGKSLFIFRRDLRLEDNTGLIEALKYSEYVLPCFIFDPALLEKNEYRSDNALQFMIESLQDLKRQLEERSGKLYLFYGKPDKVVRELIEKGIDAVYVNRDYTPFSIRRDNAIKELCSGNGIDFHQYGDCLLNEPEKLLKDDGKPYTLFTPYLRKAMNLEIRKPQINRYRNFDKVEVGLEEGNEIYKRILPEMNREIRVHGGRTEALRILNNLRRYKNYEKERDYPAKDKTTHLSAHNKFGTCSIREVYYSIKDQLGSTHALITELYWRDFFTHIALHFPKIFGRSFREKYDRIEWCYNKKMFKVWCDGITGFPIVDAGMRELNITGFMQNRIRMITSSFLTKDLHIDWRWGERYFARKLVDYDPSVNNGNWQWSASTGSDAQPYFRIFNPWLQQRKYDPKCEYIKRWVTELRDLSPKEIHNLDKRRPSKLKDYPEPMVDHSEESRVAKSMFSGAG